MSYSELANVIAELKLHFNSPGRSALLAQTVQSTETSADPAQFLQRWVLDIVDGGITAAEIQAQIDQFVKDGGEESITTDTIQVIDAAAINVISGEQTNTSEKSNDKAEPVISHILVKKPEISLSSRFADAAALLMTVVPSYEWSRAVPYLNVTLHSSRSALDSSNRVSATSLSRFLLGPKTVDPNTVEGQFVKGPEFTNAQGNTQTIAGMELFTSPQTLVNVNKNSEVVRSTPVIDPFRPFMSIKSLNLSIVAQGAGLVSYKSGELNLMLHDRSRLGDIADLIRPDLFAQTGLLIEYGWSHPDGGVNSSNVFGRLINASRVREKYRVKNHTFNFLEGGQVDIKLEIWTQGTTDLTTTHIAESPTISNATRVVENLVEQIAVYRDKITSSKSKRESIISPQVLDSLSDISKLSQLPADLMKKTKDIMRQQSQNSDVDPDTSELLDVIKKLLGPAGDGTNGTVASLSDLLQTSYKNKKATLSNGVDPGLETVGDLRGLLTEDALNKYVSLGKLLILFMSIPLGSTGRFDEVQLLTYTFNKCAGAIRSENIGSFPINISEFIPNFDKFTKSRGHYNLTVCEFLQYMISNYLDDITYMPYGLSVAAKTEWSDGGEKTNLAQIQTLEQGAIYDNVRNSMVQFGVPNGEFIPPQISFYVEAVPKAVITDNEQSSVSIDAANDSVTILRIHVFDVTDTPHYGYQKFLETLTNRYVGSADNSAEAMEEMFQEAENLKLGSIDEKAGRFIIGENITPQEIKKQVASRVPSLLYGVQGSGIKTADLKSSHQTLLGTDHMQRAQIGDPMVAPGIDGGTVPLWMFPTEINMSTMGCPFFSFGQQFFVDMSTGTDVDNIYGVMGADMSIEQGRFDTSIKLRNMLAYGSYRSNVSILQSAKATLETAQGEGTTS